MWIVVCLMLLIPSISYADYTTASVHLREPIANGLVKFTIRFSGDAGEPLVLREYTMVPASTAVETYRNLRMWANSVVVQLNLSAQAANTPVLQPGQEVPLLTPAPPAPVAQSVWRQKVAVYDLTCTKGFVGGVATACTALKADIESTYQSGFLQ